jgi:hypothetical protein
MTALETVARALGSVDLGKPGWSVAYTRAVIEALIKMPLTPEMVEAWLKVRGDEPSPYDEEAATEDFRAMLRAMLKP